MKNGIDGNGIGITGREAIARIARRSGATAGAILEREIAEHRRFSRRGALYRADIMGIDGDNFCRGAL